MTLLLMKEALRLGNKEILLLMNNSSYSYRMTTSYLEDTVYMTTEMADVLTNYESNTFTAFHNHPNNKPFSVRDMYMFLKYDKISTMLVCNNDCKETHLLSKSKSLSSKEKREIMNIKLDFSDACIKELNVYGIIYINKNGRSI